MDEKAIDAMTRHLERMGATSMTRRDWNAVISYVSSLEASNKELLVALEALSKMYSHAWNLVDGGLMMMPDQSVPMFDAAHTLAGDALRRAKGLPIYEDDDWQPEWEWVPRAPAAEGD